MRNRFAARFTEKIVRKKFYRLKKIRAALRLREFWFYFINIIVIKKQTRRKKQGGENDGTII